VSKLSRYRLGFIGCGRVSRLHLQGWAAWLKAVEVVESGALAHVLAGKVCRNHVGNMQQQVVQAHGTEGSAYVTRDLREPYQSPEP